MARIEKAQKWLLAHSLEALIIENPIDLYYLTKLKLSSGRLLIEQTKATLFVDGRYIEAAQKNAPCETALIASFKEVSIKGKLGFDMATTSYQKYLELYAQFKENLSPVESPIKNLRQIKEKEEIELLKEAARLGSEGYDFTLTLLQEGVKEEEVAMELELFWRKKGGEKVSFDPIIAFGANSSQPHYRAGQSVLKREDTVLIDIGVMKNCYASDMTRVVFFGEADPKMHKIYEIVRQAQKEAFKMCKKGVALKDVDGAARRVIEEAGYGEHFPHSLGHGVGLDVHELPLVRQGNEQIIERGMVFTVEPGIYLPGLGGVRLEDTIVITEEGYESLTQRETAFKRISG